MAERVTRRHHKLKATLVAEAGGCCCVCGYDRTVVNLHFHHVDPKTKAFVINTSRGKALDTFRAEAKKCVLVCANCHGEIEAGIIESPPPGSHFPALVGPGRRPRTRFRPRIAGATSRRR